MAKKQTQKDNSAKVGMVPLNDKVIVRPAKAEEFEKKSLSGIIIPDTISKEKPEQGTVVAVGPGKFEDGKRIPMSVKIGDKVIFSKYGFDDIKMDDTEYYILSESNILAILN